MIFRGQTNFDDKFEPVPAKNEFGIDTLTRVVKGAVTELERYVDGLRQGQSYGGSFYLQTWSADQNPIYPEITLNYKGVLGGSLPDPSGSDDVTLQTITISTTTPVKASREIQYEALATTWKYVTNSRPISARVGNVSYGRDPVVRSSVIKTEDGKIYFGPAPVGLVTALLPTIENRVISLRATEVQGTPYFEVEEVVCRMYKERS